MQWGASFACMGMTVIFLMNDRAFLTVTAFAWETKIRRARGLLNGRKIRKIMHFRNPVIGSSYYRCRRVCTLNIFQSKPRRRAVQKS